MPRATPVVAATHRPSGVPGPLLCSPLLRTSGAVAFIIRVIVVIILLLLLMGVMTMLLVAVVAAVVSRRGRRRRSGLGLRAGW